MTMQYRIPASPSIPATRSTILWSWPPSTHLRNGGFEFVHTILTKLVFCGIVGKFFTGEKHV